MGDDGIDEEVVAVLRTIAAESLSVGTFIHRTVHRLDGSIRQWSGHITDAKTNEVGFGMQGFIFVHLLGNLSEEITLGELLVVCVCANHESIYDWTIYNILFVLQITIHSFCCLAS